MLGIYCRISKDKAEGKDRSINDQKKLGIEKAVSLNLKYKVYIDEGLSGALENIKDRPAFSELIDDIQEGLVSSVFVFDQSRLERNTEMRFLIKKIFKINNIRLFTNSGEIDLNSDEDDMMGDLISVMNQYYVKITKQKIKSVLQRNAKEGKAHSSIYPYGYCKDEKGFLVIDDEESVVVRRIFDDSLNGIGTNKIAENLSNENIPTRYNKIGVGAIKTVNKYTGKVTETLKKDIVWSGNSVRGIIKNNIYKGERKFSGKTYASPIIIEPDYWEKVNANLKKNRNNSGKQVLHKYLLKGILECGVCGRNMYGRTRDNKKDNYYMCSSKRFKSLNCGNRSINIDVVEDFVWKVVLGDYNTKNEVLKDSQELINEKLNQIKGEQEKLENDILTIDNKIKKATRLVLEEIIDEKYFKQEISNLKAIEKDIKIKLVNNKEELEFEERAKKLKESFTTDAKQIRENTPFNKRQEIIQKYISRVKVYYNSEVHFYYLVVKFKTNDLEVMYPLKGGNNSAVNYFKGVGLKLSLFELQRMTEIGEEIMNNKK